jgi:hypothetical protein
MSSSFEFFLVLHPIKGRGSNSFIRSKLNSIAVYINYSEVFWGFFEGDGGRS